MATLMAKPSTLDPLTQKLIDVAVSIAHGCGCCVHARTAAARAKGMTDAQHAELLATVGLAAKTNPPGHRVATAGGRAISALSGFPCVAASRSLSGLGSVGCNEAAAVHFSPYS